MSIMSIILLMESTISIMSIMSILHIQILTQSQLYVNQYQLCLLCQFHAHINTPKYTCQFAIHWCKNPSQVCRLSTYSNLSQLCLLCKFYIKVNCMSTIQVPRPPAKRGHYLSASTPCQTWALFKCFDPPAKRGHCLSTLTPCQTWSLFKCLDPPAKRLSTWTPLPNVVIV